MSWCVLGAQCSVYDADARVPGLTHTAALCPGCHSRSSVELNLLRYDYVDLSQALPLKDRRQEVYIFRPKPESKSPMDLEVYALRSEIARVVVLAALSVADRNVSVDGVREGFALDAAASVLKLRLDDLAALGQGQTRVWVETGGTDALSGPAVLMLFGALHRRARKMVGLDAPILRLPGACPACAVPALKRRADDTEWIWCGSCGQQVTRTDYQQLLQLRIGA